MIHENLFLVGSHFQSKTMSIYCLTAPEVSESSYLKSLYQIHNVILPSSFFCPSAAVFKLVVKFTLLWYQIHNLVMHSTLDDVAISITLTNMRTEL